MAAPQNATPRPPVLVRVMAQDEFAAMREVSVRAFEGDPAIAAIIDALKLSPGWDDELSFVAEQDGEIVGQVLYTLAKLDTPRQVIDVLLLSPLAVRPDLHGLGIGTALVTQSLPVIRRRPEPVLFTQGDPGYYSRFGFRAADDLGFRPPSPRIIPGAFQALNLPTHEPWMTGALVYRDAFWDNDAIGPPADTAPPLVSWSIDT